MPDNLKNRGEPDRSLLNRNEKWEVDYFVDQFAKTNANPKTAANIASVAGKARRLLPHVPGDRRSHAHVEEWLLKNWGNFQ